LAKPPSRGSSLAGFSHSERSNTIPVDADISGEAGWNPKHFWAMVVYNFDEKAIQILEITQKSILESLQNYIHNPDWGDPRDYSITVTREGEKLGTKYEVVASPHKPTPKEVLEEYKKMNINLEALFDGKNPFDASERSEELDSAEFKGRTWFLSLWMPAYSDPSSCSASSRKTSRKSTSGTATRLPKTLIGIAREAE
jgi:hypothetical protein